MTRREDQDKRQRSTLGSVLGKVGAVAVPVGMLAKWHMNRPRRPVSATDPTKIEKGLFNRGPLVPHYDVPAPTQSELAAATKGLTQRQAAIVAQQKRNAWKKSARWMTPAQAAGIDKTPEPKSIFHRGPVIQPSAPKAASKPAATGGTPPKAAPAYVPPKASQVSSATPTGRRIDGGAKFTPAYPDAAPSGKGAIGHGGDSFDYSTGYVPTSAKGGRNVPYTGGDKFDYPTKLEQERRDAALLPKNTGRKGNKSKIARAPIEGAPAPAPKAAPTKTRTEQPLSKEELAAAKSGRKSSTSLTVRQKTPEEKAADEARRAARAAEQAAAAPSEAEVSPKQLRKDWARIADGLARIKSGAKKKVVETSARLARLRQFNTQGDGGLFTAADTFGSQYRRARRIMPWVNRAQGAAEDVGDMASGKKVEDPFYKKGWFKMGAMGAAVGAPLYAVRKWHKLAVQQHKFPGSIRAMSPKTGALQEKFLRTGQKLDDLMKRKGWTSRSILTNPNKPSIFNAKTREVYLRSRVRQIMFDLQSEEKGWDLRDARGRSARVYAPGSRRRERREKSWDEKTDNIRAMRNVAVLGALGAAGGAGVLGLKLSNTRAAAKVAEEQAANRIIAAEQKGLRRMAERVGKAVKSGKMKVVAPHRPHAPAPGIAPVVGIDDRLKHASDSRRIVMLNSLHKLIDSGQRNIDLPNPEIVDAVNYTLDDRDRRSLAKKALGGAALIGGGALGGYLGGRKGGNKVASVLERAAHSTRKNSGRYGALVGAGLGTMGAGLLLR